MPVRVDGQPVARPASRPAPVPAAQLPASLGDVGLAEHGLDHRAGGDAREVRQPQSRHLHVGRAHRTTAGKTWQGGPAPSDHRQPSGPPGVSGLRFLDGVNGWAFGPELWATHDAGHTWTQGRHPAGSGSPTSRRPATGRTRCSPGAPARTPTASPSGCTSFTLMTTPRPATTGCRSAARQAVSPMAGAPRRRFSRSPVRRVTCSRRTGRSTPGRSAAPGSVPGPCPASRAPPQARRAPRRRAGSPR